MNPRVTEVKPANDYHLELTFSNGEKRVFDVKPYLNTGRFEQLKNETLFRSVVCTMGSVQWQNGLDLCPDMLFEESVGSTGSPTGGTEGSPTGGSTSSPTGGTEGSPTGGSTGSPTGGTEGSPTGGSTSSPTGGSTSSPTGGPTGSATGGEKVKVK
jgi:hypothetical protein